MDFVTLQLETETLSSHMASERLERQLRRQLDPADFEAMHRIGYSLVGVPVAAGGLWDGVEESARPVCELLRLLARGDSSVALVSAMHPAVLSYWLTAPGRAEDGKHWGAQCGRIYQSVLDGCWWGTITSEPGSGGDISRTIAQARRVEGDSTSYRLTGKKHFGSGSGVMSFMVTTAIPEGEEKPDWFYVDLRGAKWDGSQGIQLLAEWDGHGMTATQSHSFSFEDFPATRIAWPGNLAEVAFRTGGFIGCLFTSVIVGIIDAALQTARESINDKQLPSFEQIEWARARAEAWSIQQIYDGMLRAVETTFDPRTEVIYGKTMVAELAETVLLRLCRVMGGSTFSRRSPFGFWFEDVRALGFLRPPWSLAFQNLVDGFPAVDPDP